MKDLIAKLKSEANVALGAIWLHIDAQAARIAELEAQQAFGIGETYANALSRIAELEAQIAAASAPVVEQKPVTNNGWLIDGSLVYKLDPTNTMNAFEINVTQAEGSRKHDGPRVELAKRILAWLTAPQPAVGADKVICANLGELLLTQAERKAADTDKLREAIANISNNQITEVWESCGGVDGFYKSFGYQQFAHAILDLAADTVASTALQAPVREVPDVRPGIEAVVALIQKQCDDYHRKHGSQEPDTGVWNYPGDGNEWMCDREELLDEIRALLPADPVQPEAKP